MNFSLGIDAKVTVLAAGLIFLLALVLGVWKYRQIMTSADHRAHPYVDIAHRAALLYSFARLAGVGQSDCGECRRVLLRRGDHWLDPPGDGPADRGRDRRLLGAVGRVRRRAADVTSRAH